MFVGLGLCSVGVVVRPPFGGVLVAVGLVVGLISGNVARHIVMEGRRKRGDPWERFP